MQQVVNLHYLKKDQPKKLTFDDFLYSNICRKCWKRQNSLNLKCAINVTSDMVCITHIPNFWRVCDTLSVSLTPFSIPFRQWCSLSSILLDNSSALFLFPALPEPRSEPADTQIDFDLCFFLKLLLISLSDIERETCKKINLKEYNIKF